jgi:hypothetical protein
MPNVKGKKFSYTKKGIADAKAYAKKTGAKLQMYAYGGNVKPKMGSGGVAKKKK